MSYLIDAKAALNIKDNMGCSAIVYGKIFICQKKIFQIKNIYFKLQCTTVLKSLKI